jgi:hypothetical protein
MEAVELDFSLIGGHKQLKCQGLTIKVLKVAISFVMANFNIFPKLPGKSLGGVCIAKTYTKPPRKSVH